MLCTATEVSVLLAWCSASDLTEISVTIYDKEYRFVFFVWKNNISQCMQIDSVCVCWAISSTLSQAFHNCALVFTSCLWRASRSAGGKTLEPSHVSPERTSSSGHAGDLVDALNMWELFKTLIPPRVSISSLTLNFPPFLIL